MLNFDEMEVDLSTVKEESLDFDDYEENRGNILDNFIAEDDYGDYIVPTLPCDEDDVDVDWLSSFFDEPTQENASGLNPSLTDISSTHLTPISNIASLNGNTGSLSADTYSGFTDSCVGDISCDESRRTPAQIPTMHNNYNPYFPEINTRSDEMDTQRRELKQKVKTIRNIENKINDEHFDDTEEKTENEKYVVKTNNKNQRKVLLLMNTPKNRAARLVGRTVNMVNTDLVTNLPSQGTRIDRGLDSTIDLKRSIDINNRGKQEFPSDDKIIEGISSTLVKSIAQNGISHLTHTNLFQGPMMNDEDQNQEVDSGYESPTSSFASSPTFPTGGMECNSLFDTIHYIDIPPHERRPFYLSEEEKRTLMMEGLPIPTGLPLSKTEEKALKKVRRKIKNKISAQESRRKKKEYMELLEKKVESYANANNGLKKKVNGLETTNRSLIIQVQKMQGIITSKLSKNVTSSSKCSQTESVVM